MGNTIRRQRQWTRRNGGLVLLLLLLTALSGTLGTAQVTRAADEPAPRAGEHAVFLPLIVNGQAQTSPTSPFDLPFDPSTTRTGDGTYYGATGAGNCMFDASPQDLMVGAMNNTDYANAWLCGAYVQVTGPKGTIVVRIVDRCPECQPGDIDLSQEAFAKIAEVAQGRVDISWKIISPSVSTPVSYRFKEGSSQWWTAVQVRNHRNPIYKFEYLASNGQFKEVPRLDYNYFVADSGMGPGPYTFRITDIYGQTITDSGIGFVAAGVVTGSQQFPQR